MAVIVCPECGEESLAGADYCANCGHDLNDLDHPAGSIGSAPEFIMRRLADLPARAPMAVAPADPVGLAVRLMQNEGVDCVLVMDGALLTGVITPWDILHKVAGPKEDLNAVTCAQVMTADPVYLREDDTVAVAINKMAVGGFRHIPLMQGGAPANVISIGEVFHHIAPYLG